MCMEHRLRRKLLHGDEDVDGLIVGLLFTAPSHSKTKTSVTSTPTGPSSNVPKVVSSVVGAPCTCGVLTP